MSNLWKVAENENYYHASPEVFKSGDWIIPGADAQKNNWEHEEHLGHVFLTDNPHDAHRWAHHIADVSPDNKKIYVYKVEAPKAELDDEHGMLGPEYVAPHAQVVGSPLSSAEFNMECDHCGL